jgi:putative membrane protein
MFAARQDDVSNIHRRWSFTKINPSSYKQSFVISLTSAAVVAIFSHLFYLGTDLEILVLYIPIGLGTIASAHVLDYLALRGTPVNKFSKVVHVSAFANSLWALTVVLGVAVDFVFSKHGDGNYVLAGLLLAVGLRIGIFTSVFGAGILRAIVVSFIQPVVFFFAFLGLPNYHIIISPLGIAFGFALVALGISWEIIADRAGRPGIKSTFSVLQAFLAAWTENKVEKMEEFMEEKAYDNIVYTKIIKFAGNGNSSSPVATIVLPDVHPGPFGMVGGSNLPHIINNAFSKSALVLHSVSDHSLNIPSRGQVDRYVSDLYKTRIKEKGNTCSRPVQCKIHNATTTGIAFGNTAIIMLSLAPTGMEDVPRAIRDELESHAANIGFSNVLVIDCHNAMGKQLNNSDRIDLVTCSKKCLDQLKNEPQHEFTIGYASLSDVSDKLSQASELGQAGLATVVIGIADSNFAIAWADSNNMDNNLRDYVISRPAAGIKMLEICTSDTHSTSGKRTKEGYFALGTVSSHDDIAQVYHEMCKKAFERIGKSTFEYALSQSTIKVMGNKQFQDYSSALDKSLSVTKVFLGLTVATYIAMLVLS